MGTGTDTVSSLINSLTDEQVAELMADDISPEYDIDYSKAQRNRFVQRDNASEIVRLDADVAAVFKTEEAVNAALRALIQAMPRAAHKL